MKTILKQYTTLFLSIVISIVFWCAYVYYERQLYDIHFFSGWVLFTLLMILCIGSLIRVNRKIFLNASYAYYHSVVGLLALFVFLNHLQWQWPSGYLESSMAVLLIVLSISGVLGLWIKTYYSQRILRQDEVVFDDMPHFRKTIQLDIEQVLAEANACCGTTVLSDFYRVKLKPSLLETPPLLWRLVIYPYKRRQLSQQIRGTFCLLDQNTHASLRRLQQLINKKFSVEHRYAKRLFLQRWRYFHQPVTFLLISLIVIHMILVYTFIE